MNMQKIKDLLKAREGCIDKCFSPERTKEMQLLNTDIVENLKLLLEQQKDLDGFVEQILVLSTCHIQKEDKEMLERVINEAHLQNFHLPVYNYGDYGWIVCLPDNIEELGPMALDKDYEMSPNFWSVLIHTMDNYPGTRRIQFDCDGPIHPDLPEFEW